MARHQRAIDVDTPEPQFAVPGEWARTIRTAETVEHRRRVGTRLFINRTTVRVDPVSGDTKRVVEEIEKSAVVQYAEIVKRCKVEPDDDARAPWNDLDGWEHHLLTQDAFETKVYETTHVNHKWSDEDYCRERYRKMREDFKVGCGYFATDRGDRKWIVLDYDVSANFDYMRSRGASKQVARELAAAERRRSIQQLVKWYENGYESWYVSGSYRGRESSVGWDDEDTAATEGIRHVADEIASELERDGYIISGEPPEPKRFKNGYTPEGMKDRITRQMQEQNVSRR